MGPPRPGDRSVAADFVWLLHGAIVVIVVMAPLLPYASLWWMMIGLAPAMHMQWRLNDDRCLLTDLEQSLRGKNPSSIEGQAGVEAAEVRESFIGSLLEPVIGRASERAADLLSHGVLWLSFSGSVFRLCLS